MRASRLNEERRVRGVREALHDGGRDSPAGGAPATALDGDDAEAVVRGVAQIVVPGVPVLDGLG